MNRFALLQLIVNRHNFNKYLEIGTFTGKSLLPLKCNYKIAIDPCFKIRKRTHLKWIIKNPTNIRNRYFEMFSNDFFEQKESFLIKTGKLDLVFIDGEHTFKASLIDTLNSLKHIRQKGFIVLHDCYPPTDAAAIYAESYAEARDKKPEGWTGSWCGDVWKTIVYLKEKYKDYLKVTVLDADFGLGILKIKEQVSADDLKLDEALFEKVNKLEYRDLKKDTSIINLIPVDGLNQFIES